VVAAEPDKDIVGIDNRLMTGRGQRVRLRRKLVPDTLIVGACGMLLAVLIPVSLHGARGPVVALAVAFILLVVAILGLTRAGIASVTLGAFFAPMNAIGPAGTASFWTFADAFLLLGFLFLLPRFLDHHVEIPPVYGLGAGLLVLSGLIASTLSSAPGQSFNEFSRLLTSSVFLPLAFLTWRPNRDIIRLLAGGYVVGTAVSFAFGFFGNYTSAEGRYAGLAEHPNELGLTGVFAIALTPFLYHTSRPGHRWVWLVLAALNFDTVWVSGSRAALLTVLILAAGYPVVNRSARAAGWVLLGLSSVLLFSNKLLSEQGSHNALGRLLGGGSSQASDEDRTERIQTTWGVFRAHPIVGEGFINTLYAHVGYLEVAAAAGIFGLVGFCAILYAADKSLLTVPGPMNLLSYPAIAYSFVALITNVLWDRYIWVPLSLSLLAWSRSKPDEKLAEQPVGASRGVNP
jgi:hypothetical protein